MAYYIANKMYLKVWMNEFHYLLKNLIKILIPQTHQSTELNPKCHLPHEDVNKDWGQLKHSVCSCLLFIMISFKHKP